MNAHAQLSVPHTAAFTPSAKGAISTRLGQLVANLTAADAELDAAIDAVAEMDKRTFDARQRGEAEPDKAETRAVQSAEARGHDSTGRALYALCKYQPRTAAELSLYVEVICGHWTFQAKIGGAFAERDAQLVRMAVKNINAAALDLLLNLGES